MSIRAAIFGSLFMILAASSAHAKNLGAFPSYYIFNSAHPLDTGDYRVFQCEGGYLPGSYGCAVIGDYSAEQLIVFKKRVKVLEGLELFDQAKLKN